MVPGGRFESLNACSVWVDPLTTAYDPKNDLRNRTLTRFTMKAVGLHPENSAADPVVTLSALSGSRSLANGRRLIGPVVRVPDHQDSHAIRLLTSADFAATSDALESATETRAGNGERSAQSNGDQAH
jgi:hypothetical protein